MIAYKITVKSLGRITQLLDSQKIFGAIVYLLSSKLVKEKVDQFVLEISVNTRIFMVSNLVPKDHFPTPYGDIENGDKKIYQRLKKKKFIPAELLEKPIRNVEKFVKIEENQDAKYRISNEFFNTPGLKNDLFSIPTVEILEVVQEASELKVIREITDFDFYLAFEEKNEITSKILELLQKLKSDKEIFLYGQKVSQGYNTYLIEKIKPISNLSWEDATCFLNLGMLLPNDENQIIDYTQSKFKLFTSERRPYQMGIGQGKFERDNNFISFVEAGSVIKLKSNLEGSTVDKLRQVGKSVDSPYQPKNEKRIVFGQSFLYPLKEVPKL